jgi:hypothetical protein
MKFHWNIWNEVIIANEWFKQEYTYYCTLKSKVTQLNSWFLVNTKYSILFEIYLIRFIWETELDRDADIIMAPSLFKFKIVVVDLVFSSSSIFQNFLKGHCRSKRLIFIAIHTYIPLTLYPRRGSRGISDIPPRHPRFTKIS